MTIEHELQEAVTRLEVTSRRDQEYYTDEQLDDIAQLLAHMEKVLFNLLGHKQEA